MVKRFSVYISACYTLFVVSQLLNRREKSVSSAAAILMFSLLLTNILGLLKLRLLSNFFGASSQLGVFLAADRLPSFIFNLFVIGALSSSFIPIFAAHLAKEGKAEAFKFSSIIINVTFVIFGLFSVVLFIFSPQLSYLLSLGSLDTANLVLMSDLTRILIISQLLLSLSIFVTSILQSFDHFLIPSLSPIFYNLGSIAGIVFLTPILGIYAPAWGAVIGSVLHLLIQIPFLKSLGFKYAANFNFRDKSVIEVSRLIIPRTFGLAVDQINLLVDTALSLSLSAASVVVLSFAQRLQYIPVILFGSTISQAVLPTLSRLSSDGYRARDDFKNLLIKSLHQMLYLILPVSIILLVLRLPLVRLIFGTKRFDWYATNMTGYTLAFYSLGIFSQSVSALLTRAFYAFKDTRTPFKTGALSVALNIILSILFVKVLGFNVWSLALSSSVSSLLNALLLFVLLQKRVGSFNLYHLLDPITKMAFSGLVMGVFIYLPLKLLDRGGWGGLFPYTLGVLLLDTRYTVNLLILTALSTILGLIFYLLLTSLLKVSEGRRIVLMILRIRNFGRNFFPSIFQE